MFGIWNWSRVLLHVPVGIATGGLTLIEESGNTLALIATLGFIVYEWIEDKWLRDKAFHDLAGWMIGLFLSAGLVALVRGVLW